MKCELQLFVAGLVMFVGLGSATLPGPRSSSTDPVCTLLECIPSLDLDLAELSSGHYDLCSELAEPAITCINGLRRMQPEVYDIRLGRLLPVILEYMCTEEFAAEMVRLQNCKLSGDKLILLITSCILTYNLKIQVGTHSFQESTKSFEGCVKCNLRVHCGSKKFVMVDKGIAFAKASGPETRGTIGAMCLQDEECKVELSHCQMNMCKCKDGFTANYEDTLCMERKKIKDEL